MLTLKKDPKSAPSKKEVKKLPLGKRVLELFKSIGFALVAVIILNSFAVQSFQVPTGSMENTVMAGELLFVNKYLYGGSTPQVVPLIGVVQGWLKGIGLPIEVKEIEIPWFHVPGFRDPRKGDVIVFIWPGYRDEAKAKDFQYYLKRCVAVSHDTIRIVNKTLYVNGAPFDNPPGVLYTPEVIPANMADPSIFPAGMPWNRDNYGPLVVPGKGDVIELTKENINLWFTFMRREGHQVDMQGETILVDGRPAKSYTVQRDYVFGMGDNRDDSLDSRFWGFIPKEHVIGTPIIVYMSLKGGIRFHRLGTIIR